MLQPLYPKEKSPGTYYLEGWIYPRTVGLVSFILQPLYPTEKSPGTYCIGSWIYPRTRVDALEHGENPTSLLGLNHQFFPPVAYTLHQLCCSVSNHPELVLFIYFALELEKFSQYNNTLHYGRFGFQTPVGARILKPFQTGPKVHLPSTTMYTAALSQEAKW
jgi:hypothetical protein